jgi:hypothetical protein
MAAAGSADRVAIRARLAVVSRIEGTVATALKRCSATDGVVCADSSGTIHRSRHLVSSIARCGYVLWRGVNGGLGSRFVACHLASLLVERLLHRGMERREVTSRPSRVASVIKSGTRRITRSEPQ